MAYEKDAERELTRHNVILVKGDFDKLSEAFPRRASEIIRNLVRKFVHDNVDSKR
jgi:hypothetical protein